MIRLAENFRAVFYTPFYAAQALDAYGRAGVAVEVSTTRAPGESLPRVLSGEIDVCWGGPMRVLDLHARDAGCPLVCFGEVVRRDPFFLVGSRPRPRFSFDDLPGRRFAVVSEVATPWLCLRQDLREAGIDPAALTLAPMATMAENAERLRAGRLDVIQVFEPYVEALVREGAGHVWYASAWRGPTSYTSFYTTRRVVAEKAGELRRMRRALARVGRWLGRSRAEDVAAAVAGFFPGLAAEVLTGAVGRYQELGVWGFHPLLSRRGFPRLKRALLAGGLMIRDVAYEACVATDLGTRDGIDAA